MDALMDDTSHTPLAQINWKLNMSEPYLQAALEFFKEIWFQLDSILGLEETETFKLIKPYLLELQDTPTYIVIAFAMLILIPLGLYKAKSIARERERKVEKLIEEMDEEEFDELHVDTQKVMGNDEEDFKLEPISPELAKPNLNKDVTEFKKFDFDSQGGVKEGSSHESTINKLTEQLESAQETTSSAKVLNNIIIDDDATLDDDFHLGKETSTKESFKELALPKTNESINDPEPKRNYSVDDKSGRENNSQINRLKYLQEILGTPFDYGEIEDTPPRPESNIQSTGDSPLVEEQNFIPKSPKVTSTDNKKYMKALESFIFLKDQKNH